METETAASEAETGTLAGSDTRGKHRILAELNSVEQELKFLEKELEELEETDSVSTLCEELLSIIDATPDPLLPVANDQFNPVWDRWFEGPVDARGCGCKIL